MVIQLDYCSNILKAINPGIGSILLFYHSCDHDRGREDGLKYEQWIYQSTTRGETEKYQAGSWLPWTA